MQPIYPWSIALQPQISAIPNSELNGNILGHSIGILVTEVETSSHIKSELLRLGSSRKKKQCVRVVRECRSRCHFALENSWFYTRNSWWAPHPSFCGLWSILMPPSFCVESSCQARSMESNLCVESFNSVVNIEHLADGSTPITSSLRIIIILLLLLQFSAS